MGLPAVVLRLAGFLILVVVSACYHDVVYKSNTIKWHIQDTHPARIFLVTKDRARYVVRNPYIDGDQLAGIGRVLEEGATRADSVRFRLADVAEIKESEVRPGRYVLVVVGCLIGFYLFGIWANSGPSS